MATTTPTTAAAQAGSRWLGAGALSVATGGLQHLPLSPRAGASATLVAAPARAYPEEPNPPTATTYFAASRAKGTTSASTRAPMSRRAPCKSGLAWRFIQRSEEVPKWQAGLFAFIHPSHTLADTERPIHGSSPPTAALDR